MSFAGGSVCVSNPENKKPQRSIISDEQALKFHAEPPPGKLALLPTKPMATQRDLSLAYSLLNALNVLGIHSAESILKILDHRNVLSLSKNCVTFSIFLFSMMTNTEQRLLQRPA